LRRDREHTVSCKRRGPWIPLVGVSQGTKWAGDVAVAVQSGGLTILGEKLDRFVDGRHQAKCGHEWNDVLGPRGWKVSALPRDTVRYHDQYEWRGLPCQRTSAIYLFTTSSAPSPVARATGIMPSRDRVGGKFIGCPPSRHTQLRTSSCNRSITTT